MGSDKEKDEPVVVREATPSQSDREAFLEPRKPPFDQEIDVQEALRNFRAYIDILREWDEKEKLNSTQTGKTFHRD